MKNKKTSSILIIEDDAMLAANLQEMLETKGYGVAGVAGNLDHARRLFTEKDADLLLVDINLQHTSPGMNGIMVASRLVDERKVPIIFITANFEENYREKTRFLHPAAYLIKPVQERQLDVSVDFALFNWYESRRKEVVIRPTEDRKIYIKVDGRNQGVWLSDICYLNADSSNCWLYTKRRRHYLSTNMGSVLEQINSTDIVKILHC